MVNVKPEVLAAVPEKLKRELDWIKVIILLHLNVLSLLGVYFLSQTLIRTWLFAIFLIVLGTLGVTAGAHRLWAHASYKATRRLRIFLMICQTLVGQGSIYNWVLQHRIHHKYLGTNFDPYNVSRGFIYSHIVHYIEKPHEHQEKLEAEIDMSDLEKDGVVMFQKKYYWLLYAIVFVLLPINAPAEYWGENIVVSLVIIGFLRYYLVLNMSWLVHSATNIWGLRPDERYPSDSNIVFFVKKTYWLDYHYLTPWDYLTSEFGKYGTDCTTKFIRICEVMGMVSDMKTIDTETIKEVTYQAIVAKRPLREAIKEVEDVAVERQYYLKPLNLMM